jgi:hypothetical protein
MNGPGARRRLAPSPAGGGPGWPCRHYAGVPGRLDESARRLSHEELAVARTLVREGHQVSSLAERPGVRTADLLACATLVEVKSFRSPQERGGRPPGPRAVANKLLDARGQGSVAVIWAGASGLSAVSARSGYERFRQWATVKGFGGLQAVRVLGGGLDLGFSVRPQPAPGGARAQPVRRLGARFPPPGQPAPQRPRLAP